MTNSIKKHEHHERVLLHELMLRRAGFEVFLPLKKEMRPISRYRPEKHLVASPLLADWIFVSWPVSDNRWADLMALDLVAGVMGTGGRPVRMGHRRIIKMMRLWGKGVLRPEHNRYLRDCIHYDIGDAARVIAGPWAGFTLRIEEVSGMSVKALIDIFGRETPVEIQADMLEKVN